MAEVRLTLLRIASVLALGSVAGGIAALVLGTTRKPQRTWLIVLGSLLLMAGVFGGWIFNAMRRREVRKLQGRRL